MNCVIFYSNFHFQLFWSIQRSWQKSNFGIKIPVPKSSNCCHFWPVLGPDQKIRVFGWAGFMKNRCRRGNGLKREVWTVCRFKGRGVWQERRGWYFWGGQGELIPQCTVCLLHRDTVLPGHAALFSIFVSISTSWSICLIYVIYLPLSFSFSLKFIKKLIL